MNMLSIRAQRFRKNPAHKAEFLGLLARPIPLPLINYVLDRTIVKITKKYPTLFNRLSGHHHKTFLIEITNLSFDLILCPNPASPHLLAIRKKTGFHADATISGSFLALIGMVDGRLDGDALFFTRDLQISGDTEAIVCLRNALDDVEGSVASEAASYFGPIGMLFLTILIKMANEHQYST
ncbi:MAG: sterol-binding protein [Betaproteobacteria bacterium]|nr:sterol-binding protein [Betaproteobacteria bacterium]